MSHDIVRHGLATDIRGTDHNSSLFYTEKPSVKMGHMREKERRGLRLVEWGSISCHQTHRCCVQLYSKLVFYIALILMFLFSIFFFLVRYIFFDFPSSFDKNSDTR